MRRDSVPAPPRAVLIERFDSCWKLAHSMAYRAARRRGHLDADDFVQAALTGAWLAAHNFDEGTGVLFTTFAHYYIRDEIRRCAWKFDVWGFQACRVRWRERKRTPSEQTCLLPGSFDRVSLDDVTEKQLEGFYEHHDSLDDLDLIESLLSAVINSDARLAIRLRHLEGKSDEQIGRRLSVTKHRVYQLVKEGMRQIQERLRAMERDWLGKPSHPCFNGTEFTGSREVFWWSRERPCKRHRRRNLHALENSQRLQTLLVRDGYRLEPPGMKETDFLIFRQQDGECVAAWSAWDGYLYLAEAKIKCLDWTQVGWYFQFIFGKEGEP